VMNAKVPVKIIYPKKTDICLKPFKSDFFDSSLRISLST